MTMTPPYDDEDLHDTVSDEVLEQAAAWHARLREPTSDPLRRIARETEFQVWLKSNPGHIAAYKEMDALWEAIRVPAKVVASEEAEQANSFSELSGSKADNAPARRPRYLTPIVMAACLVALAFLGVGARDSVRTTLLADFSSGVGEQVELSLQDGSDLVLNGNSAISVDLGDARRRVELLKGEVWFDVETDVTRPFVVETPIGNVTVTGTSFGVRLDDDQATISLVEGSVRLSTPASEGDGVSLMAGQSAVLTQHQKPSLAVLDQSAATAWLRGQAVFYDTSLGDVVEELNRYHTGNVVIFDEELRALKVSGVFNISSPNEALEAITSTLQVEVMRLTDYFILLH